ncbi:MAG TPA: TylF/MycF/NovP-related O-methyltransferase [Gemmatimonadaceae bacterium]|nr:TylF/MycF/NovP-related O-methyltransferase [Gemmatimonadaceae bacterium]
MARAALKAPLKRALALLGYQIARLEQEPEAAPPQPTESFGRQLPLWDTDTAFQALRREMEGYTLVSDVDSYFTYRFAQHARSLPGDVAEVGVYKGGTARMLAKIFASSGKAVHLFDTFAGMPPVDPTKDLHRESDFGDATLEGVREYLRDCPDVHLHQGFFPATAGPIESSAFCFVHADVDIHQSVLDCCRFFYPRLVPGGVIIFDDYGRNSCPGAKVAVDQFFAETPEKPVYVPTGQAFVVKR